MTLLPSSLPHVPNASLSDVPHLKAGLEHLAASPEKDKIRAWAKWLRENPDRQYHGGYRDPKTGCMCALGVFLIEIEGLDYVQRGRWSDNKLAEALSLPTRGRVENDVFWAVANLNDHTDNLGLTFPQIADVLEALI